LDVGIEGAVISRFDLNEDWDMDSADYRFGLPIGYRKGNVAVKIHAWHLTSHLGDELITRTGARALRYNKEELAFGFACDITPEVRLYADGGWGFHLDGPKERWRFQLGGEWVREHLWEGAPRTFVACDLKWREDTGDWAISMQGGFWMIQSSAAATAGMRILLEYYRGTAAQTQFPDERDHYWALGFAAGF
ncbi:MAG: DUF1207 domain-containing protein, partial [Planctomycetes bacterium]|nr:DUF1207 domain-containing protein [Planctomycetota bacterium]